MENGKPMWASKTLWVNFVASAASVALLLGVDVGLDTAGQAEVVIVIMGAVNIALRFVTTKAVE